MGSRKELTDYLFGLKGAVSMPDFLRDNPDPVFVTASKSHGKRTTHTLSGGSVFSIMNPWTDIRVHLIGDYGEENNFKGTLYRIGRQPKCDISIEDATVSSLHAFVMHGNTDGKLYVQDANSKNGTWVRSGMTYNKLGADEKFLLSDGSVLKFGDVAFEYYTPSGFWMYLQTWKKIFDKRGGV